MGTTNVKGLLFSIVLINLSLVGFCGYPRKPVDVPFWKNYEPSWASHHIKFLNGGSAADLILDRSSGTKIVAFFSICFITTFSYALTFKIFLRKKLKIPFCVFEGAGFQSKKSYLFGHFSMKMRLVGGDSAGVVTAFYVSTILLFSYYFPKKYIQLYSISLTFTSVQKSSIYEYKIFIFSLLF